MGRFSIVKMLVPSVAILLGAVLVASPVWPDPSMVVAVANFDFLDTSGEIKNQKDTHDRRLTALSDYLRQQLSGSGKLEIVDLPCQSAQCTATDPGFEKLSEQAKQAGARFLIIGIVKKTSTLIGWIEYSVLGVDDQRAICGELVSYRDDTDESWRRAARFSASQILKRCAFGVPAQ
ncbi:hypothetical protein CU102_15280 [Phyllobacterium brassicacearum]|uniref:DUF2380 domain-containing protein n=3 Tax=Phyllobacterium brassicacearum TaxID=314235 RepID=A0A2P7BNB0_9HYPH|nr:hypothetical protein CU102_15280 [Phyllobacterium brassicacearum]